MGDSYRPAGSLRWAEDVEGDMTYYRQKTQREKTEARWALAVISVVILGVIGLVVFGWL